MKKYKNYTVEEYLQELSAREPVPGGGSAAALSAALGVALISMVANYSKGKSSSKAVEKSIRNTFLKSEKTRKRLLTLVDLDAQAYLKVVQTRKSAPKVRRAALKQASKVPLEIAKLCFSAIQLTPVLVKKGNPHLVSDVEVAVELLLASFKSAMINVSVNQQ